MVTNEVSCIELRVIATLIVHHVLLIPDYEIT